MTTKIFVDRSRYETGLSCARRRWHEYHDGPARMGIVSARKPLPLAVGSSVHVGLAVMLRNAQTAIADKIGNSMAQALGFIEGEKDIWMMIEERAVAAALADFAQYESAIDVDTGEIASRATLPADAPALSEMDEYLYREQCALVEAMVRAYARRRLRPLLEQFEVLEVEREGEWKLSEWWNGSQAGAGMPPDSLPDCELWFMSRPDALLRERESNQLYLLSFKTTAAWDIRKARDAEHDMQGMSEGIEIERRLAEWWKAIQIRIQRKGKSSVEILSGMPPWEEWKAWTDAPPNITLAMYKFLESLDAPPRILAVRYEFLLKSDRWVDKDLSARFGCEMRSQRSPLIRQYVAVSTPARGTSGYNIGDVNCSWDYIREDGQKGSLAWQQWKSRPVWEEPGGVKAWIDKLDTAAPTMSGEDSTVGLEPRLLGYKCDAQVLGYLKDHPLDAAFISPITIFRNDDELRDLVEQMEAQERRIAEATVQVHAASDAGEARRLLNIYFPQTRRACFYPSQCQFTSICFGSDALRQDPVASGMFKVRQPNHPQERDANAIQD